MDEKRTIVAFVIIGAIIVLMPYYLEWLGVSSSPTPTSRPDTSQETAPRSTAGPAAVAQPSLPLPGAMLGVEDSARIFVPRDVVVSTPLHQLTFSTLGGVLTSAKLPQFKISSSEHRAAPRTAELLPAGGRGFTLELTLGDQAIDLSGLEFVPNREGLMLQEGEKGDLRFSARLPGGERWVEKVFQFDAERYGITTEVRLGGFGQDPGAFLGWDGGIGRTERSEETDLSSMKALAFINEDLSHLAIAADENRQQWEDKGQVKLVGVRNKYFISALAPLEEGYFRASLRADHSGLSVPNYAYRLGISLSSGTVWKNLLYIGPLDYEELSGYGRELERAMDLGWPVIREISALLMVVFVAAYGVIPNYGWVIVLFALGIKILVYPLTQKSFESANKMQMVQPKLLALREKYKNDPQRLSRETMKLYQEEGINPLGGCLPMLLQMPIFFALYNVFSNTIELRQAPFMLWIQDLSLPDEVILGGLGIHVLPLLMAVSMFFQSKMTMKDPKQAVLVYLMPVMMIFIFWTLSSGLVLYWTVFNVLSIAQQWLTERLRK
ncbi:MAG: membrane protein insertase YidC [Candidatus Handelsmanbacteria bacterium]|nr:membrane protein insertase YidC [Candidatus Handelsmanbacteria bacterium]